MPSVALATYQASPQINDDDRLAADVLRARGVTVIAQAWDEQGADWSRFDCVVIRSAWDYHLKPARYEQWLRTFLATPERLWNPPAVVLGNLHKRYLVALAEKGAAVVPTICQPAAKDVALEEVLNFCQWPEAVIKPAISASAHGTWRTSSASAAADQVRFAEQVQLRDILIQPYLPEIAAQGEWSLIYFDGAYSHAVLKRPAGGDFRVQREFGGSASPAEPAPALIEQARSILAAVGEPLLYARVDGIERSGRFVLTELEINEPFLFLGSAPGAAKRFAEAILRKL